MWCKYCYWSLCEFQTWSIKSTVAKMVICAFVWISTCRNFRLCIGSSTSLDLLKTDDGSQAAFSWTSSRCSIFRVDSEGDAGRRSLARADQTADQLSHSMKLDVSLTLQVCVSSEVILETRRSASRGSCCIQKNAACNCPSVAVSTWVYLSQRDIRMRFRLVHRTSQKLGLQLREVENVRMQMIMRWGSNCLPGTPRTPFSNRLWTRFIWKRKNAKSVRRRREK